jgi:hypothetical protein
MRRKKTRSANIFHWVVGPKDSFVTLKDYYQNYALVNVFLATVHYHHLTAFETKSNVLD